jgi:hypothetical protein
MLEKQMLGFALLCGLMIGCGTSDSDMVVQAGVVAPVRQPCTGVGPQLCLVLAASDGTPTLIYGGIRGFTPRWGYEAMIRYHVEHIADPSGDGSSAQPVLDELVDEARSTRPQFDLAFRSLPPGTGWFSGTATPLDLAGTSVRCAPAVCDAIATRSEAREAFVVTMGLTDNDNALDAIAVAAAP